MTDSNKKCKTCKWFGLNDLNATVCTLTVNLLEKSPEDFCIFWSGGKKNGKTKKHNKEKCNA